MTQTTVSSCVLSIVASFTSGLDVFKKFREVRKKSRKRDTRKINGGRKKNNTAPLDGGGDDDQELRLARSLRRGPEDIGREYARSVGMVGEWFEGGDAIAQTSLAEILLRLNTGLVSIISTFLEERDVRRLDWEELIGISERTRGDTCAALRGLCQRMTNQLRGLPGRMITPEETQGRTVRGVESREGIQSRHARLRGGKLEVGRMKAGTESSHRPTKIREPILARVVIADSAKPSRVALVRPADRSKKGQSTSSSGASSKTHPNVDVAAPRVLQTPLLPEDTPAPHPQPSATETSRMRSMPDPPSQPRTAALRAAPSTPRLDQVMYEREPLPPTIDPVPVLRPEPRRRTQTPTYYSVETTSTRLGEIPLHRWAEPYDFDAMSRLNKEAEQNGWPFNEMHQTQIKHRRGPGLFRMFRKNR